MDQSPSARATRVAELPWVSADDPRVGRELVGYADLASERGQNRQAMGLLVRRHRIAPVGVVADRGGRYLFSRTELIAEGLWPTGGPPDSECECWMSEYAMRRGLPKAHVESMLRVRLAAKLGLPGPVAPDDLAAHGVARRIGKRWVVNVAVADELLDGLYDPSREATARELAAEIPGYLDGRNLSPILKRAGIPSRPIVLADGRRTFVFDRAEAVRWMGGRYEPGSGPAIRPPELWRTPVGAAALRLPISRSAIPAADAAWLLDTGPRRRPARATEDDPSAGVSDVPIAPMEQQLTANDDVEGLMLLDGMARGIFSPRPGEGRTAAMLRLLKKAGWAG
jgi:hypothetical protein